MNWTTSSKSHSLIRYLFITVLVLGTGFARVALAEDKCDSDDKDFLADCRNKPGFKKEGNNRSTCIVIEAKCSSSTSGGSGGSGDNDCRSLQSKANEASSKYNEKCASAGISMSCDSEVGRCSSAMSGEEYAQENFLLTAIGSAVGVNANRSGALKCSSMTGREYKDAKTELQKNLRESNKDLADNEDKANDLDNSYNEAVGKIEQELAENQKRYAEGLSEMSKQESAAKRNLEKQLTDLRAKERGYQAMKLKLNNQLTTLMTDKNTALSNILDSNTVTICMDKAESIKPAQTTFKSSGEQIKKAKELEKKRQAVYAACKKDIADQRVKIMQTANGQISEKTKEIQDMQSEIDQVGQDIASVTQQYNEFLQQSAQGKTDALKNLNKQIELANKARTALDQNTKKKGDALTKRAGILQQEATNYSNELLLLGPAPAKSSGDVSVSSAYSAKRDLDNALADFETTCPEDYDKRFGKSSSGKSKASTSSSKGSSGRK